MTMRTASAALVAIAVLSATPASAHRLDEYLQALRVDVSGQTIRIALDLTPGASLAPEVLAALDADRNGAIDRVDADLYAAGVLNDITVAIDGAGTRIDLIGADFPDSEELSAGLGVIRLVFATRAPRARGDHRIEIENRYRPGASVYLANALRPSSDEVTIESQTRDVEQRRLTIAYQLSGFRLNMSSASWTVAVVLLLGCSAWRRRPRKRA
jgi:hypothetical protein